jgi:CheY-like chemotaxis protein
MPSPQPQARTILVVEDQPAVRRMIVRSLREEGYRVVEASNGEEALRLLAGGHGIELVVTDLVMPELGGVQLAERVTLAGGAPFFLFITGYDRDPTTVPGPLLGKPFGPKQLVAEVAHVLAQARVDPRG